MAHTAPVARYLASIWSSRPDLQAAFPLVPGPHSLDLAAWAEAYGRHEPGHDAALLDAAVAATRGATTAVRVDPAKPPTPGSTSWVTSPGSSASASRPASSGRLSRPPVPP